MSAAIPEMHAVESSNIAAVGHDGKHLFVRFRNGGLYRYPDCPAAHFDEMRRAESPGSYLHRTVKGGGWNGEKITEPQ